MESVIVGSMAEWFCLLPEKTMLLTPLDGIGEHEFDDPAKYLQKEKKIISLQRKKRGVSLRRTKRWNVYGLPGKKPYPVYRRT